MASRYGKSIKAKEISNMEYIIRFEKLKSEYNMNPPLVVGESFHDI